MSTATDNERIIEEAHVNLTPQFNYSRHVEIIKRFVEQVTANGSKLADDQARYIEANLEHVRDAMSQLLADDIERQIQITKNFPHGPALDLHPFELYTGTMPHNGDVCGARVPSGRCGALRSDMVHTL
jgi:hypothetical protein